MIIRKAILSDAEDLAKLYIQFWEPHKNCDPLVELNKKINLKNQTEFAKNDIKRRNRYILVAEEDNKAVGFIEFFIKKNESFFKIKEYGYLNSVAVDKYYRKQGIAKTLTQHAITFLKKKNIRYVKANVYNINKIAIKSWQN